MTNTNLYVDSVSKKYLTKVVGGWIVFSDVDAPVVTAFAIPSTSGSGVIPITTFTATDNVAVTGYLINESSDTPSINDPGWVSSAPATYTVVAIGSYVLYAWAKDAAGNISTSLTDSVLVGAVQESFDGTGELGANWVKKNADGTRILREADRLRTKAGAEIAWYNDNFYNDQWSELVFKSANNPGNGIYSGPGVRLGGTAATNAYGYVVTYRPFGDHALHLWRFNGQSLIDSGTVLAEIFKVLADGDRLKIKVVGTSITVYVNDILQTTKSDLVLAGNNTAPGFVVCNALTGNDYIDWDDWKGGDIAQ